MIVWDGFALIQIGLIAVVVVFLVLPLVAATAFMQWRCKHPRYHETSSCDAICLECGKNLGFIQRWRQINPKGEARR